MNKIFFKYLNYSNILFGTIFLFNFLHNKDEEVLKCLGNIKKNRQKALIHQDTLCTARKL